MEFNINETVKIKLTSFGHKILKEYYEALHKEFPDIDRKEYIYKPLKKDENGYIDMQLWMVMNKFRPHMKLGMSEQPIDTTIIIKDIK